MQPAGDHDEANDAEGIQGQLSSEGVHGFLQRGFGSLFSLHHAEYVAEFGPFARADYDTLKTFFLLTPR